MSEDARRVRMAEDLLRHFSACAKAAQLYAPDHPLVKRAVDQLAESFERAHVESEEVVIGVIDRQAVVDGVPLLATPGVPEMVERLQALGVERMAFARGVAADELLAFVRQLGTMRVQPGHRADEHLAALSSAHITVGRLTLQQQIDTGCCDMAAMREHYRQAVAGAETIWEQTKAEGSPDPDAAIALVEGLASAIGQNRRAMLALAALHRYDNYTFTHMVNVSVLTMAQARSLGIDGALLRQFGLAGLMHDIGKIRTPSDILTKPDRLTDAEFAIMMKHPVDGAEILRRRLELPPLTAIVALEHHLRVDRTGYPAGVERPSLNLATQLCSIADVYDAMRSQRNYQRAFPTDRIVAVLQQNDRKRFDQRLVRRFGQLMGIYPAGNLVRLDDGSLAVVMRTHAPDPARPAVRVVIDAAGTRLAEPYDIALWDTDGRGGRQPRIVVPVDPDEVGLDPLAYLDGAAA